MTDLLIKPDQKIITLAEVKEVNEDKREFVAWANKTVVDRSGDVVIPKGIDTKDFEKNAVLMAFHDYYAPPVGRVLWLRKMEEGLRFKGKFADTPAGNEFWELYSTGVMKAFSIGFRVIDSTRDPAQLKKYGKGAKLIITKMSLLEISVVSIGDNQEALMEKFANNEIKTKQLREICLKVQDMTKTIHPVVKLVKPDSQTEDDGLPSTEDLMKELKVVTGRDCPDATEEDIIKFMQQVDDAASTTDIAPEDIPESIRKVTHPDWKPADILTPEEVAAIHDDAVFTQVAVNDSGVKLMQNVIDSNYFLQVGDAAPMPAAVTCSATTDANGGLLEWTDGTTGGGDYWTYTYPAADTSGMESLEVKELKATVEDLKKTVTQLIEFGKPIEDPPDNGAVVKLIPVSYTQEQLDAMVKLAVQKGLAEGRKLADGFWEKKIKRMYGKVT